MAKTAVLHARIDMELKEKVEYILAQMGLNGSDAINLFYRQIELNGGLPFELKVPEKVLATRQLLKELELGELSFKDGQGLTIEESRARLEI